MDRTSGILATLAVSTLTLIKTSGKIMEKYISAKEIIGEYGMSYSLLNYYTLKHFR